MGGFFYKTEQVTLPLRFVLLTCHCVMTIATFTNRDALATDMDSEKPDAIARNTTILGGMGIAAIVCFGIEYLSLFTGATIFIRGQMLFSLVFHAVGFSLAVPFYVENWDIESYIALTTTFIYFPAFLELVTTFFALTVSYTRF